MMLRLAVIIEGSPRFFPIHDGRVTLGSSNDNDLVVNCRGISRRHAIVERAGDRITIIDAGSTNGLLVDGVKRPEVRLTKGTNVILGEAIVRLDEVPTGDAEIAALLEVLSSARSVDALTERISPTTDTARALLRWVHAAERGEQSIHELLSEAKRILGATSLVFLRENVVMEIAGLPLLGEALRELSTDSPAHWLVVNCDYGVRFGAYYIHDTRYDWWRDFLSFVATKLGTQPNAVRAEGNADLVFQNTVIRGSSPAIERVYAQARQAVEDNFNILLLGENGSGKEVIAHLIHESDSTRSGKFIPVNVAAITASMPEAELFGIVARVATEVGAREGAFRAADHGTILLDEIGDMPLPLQAALLRVTGDHAVTPVGSSEPVPVDVRIISATNRDLEKLVREGTFRQDLYFRLNEFAITVPPLRDRPEDLMELAYAFARSASLRLNRPFQGFTEAALRTLADYPWPGNIRELEYVIKRAVLDARNKPIDTKHIEPSLQAAATLPPSASLESHVASAEETAIRKALLDADGNHRKAAKILGVSHTTLYKKMKEYGIE